MRDAIIDAIIKFATEQQIYILASHEGCYSITDL